MFTASYSLLQLKSLSLQIDSLDYTVNFILEPPPIKIQAEKSTMKQTPQVFSSVKEAVAVVRSTFSKRRSSCSILPAAGDRISQPEKIMTMTIALADICEAEEVDISQYTKEDMERLRLEDPFLFYSIPEMKRHLYAIESHPMNNSATSTATLRSSRRSSCPELTCDTPRKEPRPQRRGSVTRVRRLSVEPHPTLVIKNIMDEMELDELDDSDIDEEEEQLIQALANGTFDL